MVNVLMVNLSLYTKCGKCLIRANLQEEFEHGEKVCTRIMAEGSPTKWHNLFEPVQFFKNYKNYLQVCCPAGSFPQPFTQYCSSANP